MTQTVFDFPLDNSIFIAIIRIILILIIGETHDQVRPADSRSRALVADGKLIRLSQPGAPDRYDNTTRHDHLICTRCGALADFKFTDLTHNIEAALGARIQSYDLRIHYLCPACRKAQEAH